MKRTLIVLGILLFTGFTLLGQQIRVSGTVTDASDGSTLPGVTVLIKGTIQGATTGIDGRYELNVSPDGVLVFTFIGMKRVEIPVEGRQVINVVLEPDVALLDEIVVVGYGTRLKYELTGSISSVRAEDIESHTLPSIETALQGRTAGVHVQAGSGKLGQGIRTRIRGSSSITASNQPLYVVDGIPIVSQSLGDAGNEPTNPLADINASDIESVQVLKDASAAAIYGSRASNGVIIITTKRGKEGRTRFNVSTQLGFSEPSNYVGFLNRAQYLEMFREAYTNTAGDPYGSYSSFDSWEDALDWGLAYWRDIENPTDLNKGPDVNWEKEALRRGGNRQFDVSASGGSENTQYYTTLSFMDQVGIVNGNTFDRVSGRLNLDQKATERLSFGMNMNLIRSRNFRVADDNAFATPLQMVALPPMDPTHDPYTGELNSLTLYENGLIVRKYNNFDTEVFRNLGTVFANLEILPGLTFRSEAGIDILNQREIEYQGRLTNDGGPSGYAYDRSVTSKIFNMENYFTFNKVFFDDYDLNLVAGSSVQRADFDFAAIEGRGFPNDQFKRIASASEITFATTSGTGYRYASFFSRANMKLFDRYLVTLSARTDASSRFGRDNRWGFFPALSIGWVVTNEPFLANNKTFSFLKPRFSVGQTGNSEIDNFASRGLYLGSNYAGLPGMISSSIPSPDLRWETTTQYNVGIDFGFLNDRISGEIDYYEKYTEDLLLSSLVPASTGFTSVYMNVGSLENKGWEFVINTVNIDRAFKWNTNFNIAFNKNIVTDIDDQIIASGIWRVMEGYPIGVFYTKEYIGPDPENGDALFYRYEDPDSTATTTSLAQAENRIVGDPNPDFWGGFSNNFRYKGFDLNIMLQFVWGHDIYNGGRQWQADGFSWFDNQTLDIYNDHWTPDNRDAKYPQPRFWTGNGYGRSSLLIFDASYIRLKDVTLGYTLPSQLVQRANFQSIRVFVRAYNLWTYTEYPGWDPEADSAGTGLSNQTLNMTPGWDFYTAPQPRTITFGLNLTF
ncbi:MAG: TonB-dependent receptor [Bacteroides sp.]|jgi:TonB-linked SusC/RagA family outer membrane protein|nr:TonB-dependent receptor [Bacteroides sp.]